MEKLEMATERSHLWGSETVSGYQASEGCMIFRLGLEGALNVWVDDFEQEQADRPFQLYKI